jgi:hypothetical protein
MPLYGLFGSHSVELCPKNNIDNARKMIAIAEDDQTELLKQCQINKIVAQYHSALEHTFVWIFDAQDPHLIEEYALTTGLTSFNTIKIVPLKTLTEGLIPRAKKIHGL